MNYHELSWTVMLFCTPIIVAVVTINGCNETCIGVRHSYRNIPLRLLLLLKLPLLLQLLLSRDLIHGKDHLRLNVVEEPDRGAQGFLSAGGRVREDARGWGGCARVLAAGQLGGHADESVCVGWEGEWRVRSVVIVGVVVVIIALVVLLAVKMNKKAVGGVNGKVGKVWCVCWEIMVWEVRVMKREVNRESRSDYQTIRVGKENTERKQTGSFSIWSE